LEKTRADERGGLFRWDAIIDEEEFDLKYGEVAYRLCAKIEKDTHNFVPILELRRKNRDEAFRVFSCKGFETGDAVTIISEYEENSRRILLGGVCAKVSSDLHECNTYLSMNRVLRCVKEIKEGDEIVRFVNGGVPLEYFERIDRVVVSPNTMLVGRVGKEALEEKDSITVYFTDDSVEVVRKSHRIGYVYREKEDMY